MRPEMQGVYRCPYTGARLTLDVKASNGNDVEAGTLSAAPRTFQIVDGIPELISAEDEHFSLAEEREYAYYQANSQTYDRVMDWLFESFYEDEGRIRESMVDALELRSGQRVLETGCGTCRDSIRIANRLGSAGALFLQDLSGQMLKVGRDRILRSQAPASSPSLEFFVGNATRLPFPDGYFDAAFHFGGINLFSDRKAAIAEMARVVAPGGKVVFGDESLAPWLRSTDYGRILLNSNALYRHETPIDLLPEGARDVNLRWIIGNSFYVIDFRVGSGTPPVDLDKPILGSRGGTHRTRYFGVLEGVTEETKQLATKAAQRQGVSLHAWLDGVLSAGAKRDLEP